MRRRTVMSGTPEGLFCLFCIFLLSSIGFDIL